MYQMLKPQPRYACSSQKKELIFQPSLQALQNVIEL